MASFPSASSVTALSTATGLLSGLGNLLLAKPQNTQGYQPQNPPGPTGNVSLTSPPPSLLFHYEGEQTATLTSDITDHFLEDNTAVQDQIALKPVTITTHGFIGELNNVPPPALALLQQSNNTLGTIGAYSPGFTLAAQRAYDQAFATYQLSNSAFNSAVAATSSIGGNSGASVIGSINGSPFTVANQNLQQTYFQQFYGYWQSRTLFTIQTPWAIFQNMAILTLRAIQSAETRTTTDFEVTFKQINVASTALLGPQLQGSGRNVSQTAPNQGNGVTALNPSISVGQGLTNMGVI